MCILKGHDVDALVSHDHIEFVVGLRQCVVVICVQCSKVAWPPRMQVSEHAAVRLQCTTYGLPHAHVHVHVCKRFKPDQITDTYKRYKYKRTVQPA